MSVHLLLVPFLVVECFGLSIKIFVDKPSSVKVKPTASDSIAFNWSNSELAELAWLSSKKETAFPLFAFSAYSFRTRRT